MQAFNTDDMIFTVDDNSDLPIWVQLRNRIAYLIRTGYFKPGDQLPSVRSVSTESKINYNTVTKAYKDLEQSNQIISIRGRGMFVQKAASNVPDDEESIIDALVEDSIEQYRSLGMTYADVNARIASIVSRLEETSATASEEKKVYLDG